MNENVSLSALLCSRICHDLISPIGAIGNGLELLMLDPSAQNDELTLVSDSVANANARIRFFRIAFGAHGGRGQGVSRDELISILDDLKRGGRFNISWQSASSLSHDDAKLTLLAFMCLETAMMHSGTLTITQSEKGWCLHGSAPRLRIDPKLWEMLTSADSVHDIAPSEVHFAILKEELAHQKRPLDLQMSEQEITLCFE